MARVLVIGASRGIGLEAVKLGLERGHEIRALARTASQINISHSGLETRVGDALDPETVSAALEGIDVVIQALGVTSGVELVTRPVRLFSNATRILLPAMETRGAKRLICVTGYGAGDSRSTLGCVQGFGFRLLLGRAYDDKDVQERLIKESDLEWIIARPVILTKGSLTGRYQALTERAQWRNGLISRRDVADFLVRQIDDDAYLGKTPVLTY